MARYNDIDIKNWRNYTDIETDSLWIIPKRDNSGLHNGKYHGNFVPQIPYQLLNRYTKKGDWILDPFMGSGTTLIEAQRLGRNAIGIELQENVAQEAAQRIHSIKYDNCLSYVFGGDSRTFNIGSVLSRYNINKLQFVILHPPYWDIIKFSTDQRDLSNSATLNEFLNNLGMVIDNYTPYLERNRYCAIVIGDKYANSQIIPLGFECMNVFLKKGYLMKAIIVKNFGETKGKAQKQDIWRYRALANDFYIFKHEYIMVFKKIF